MIGGRLGQLLHPAMDIAHPDLQIDYRFTGHAETEMSRFDHTGMDRPDRDHEHALALDRTVGIVGLDPFHLGLDIKILSQRIITERPVVPKDERPGIRMPDRGDAEHVHYLAFVPVGSENLGGERPVGWQGIRDSCRQGKEQILARQREDRVQAEARDELPLIRGMLGYQGHVVSPVQVGHHFRQCVLVNVYSQVAALPPGRLHADGHVWWQVLDDLGKILFAHGNTWNNEAIFTSRS